jgi:multiple sugar transport system substrate-binding protein
MAIDRRRLIALGGAALTSAFLFPSRAAAARKSLKIIQWTHFVPAYDRWFDRFAGEWGERNDTTVTVDHIAIGEIAARAAAEIAAQKGHDLFMFLSPPAAYETQVIDHREIYEEVERRHGKAIELAIRSTFNPVTKKFFAFSESFVPDPGIYRHDLWSEAGYPNGPDTYDVLLTGGKRIRARTGNPVGLGLSQELDTNMAMRAVLWSFGGAEQDEAGHVTLDSKRTLDAVKYVRELYRSCETPEVFSWDPSSNNRGILSGRLSYVQNAISITRTAEKNDPKMAEQIRICAPPRGPERRVAPPNNIHSYVIWRFAENIAGARVFLRDLAANFPAAFDAAEFYNLPCFPSTVPNLAERLSADPKYAVLSAAASWTTNLGYPGHLSAAIDQAFNTFVIPTMFAKAARGEITPDTAVRAADSELRRIFTTWK